jgi:hypothetical protein
VVRTTNLLPGLKDRHINHRAARVGTAHKRHSGKQSYDLPLGWGWRSYVFKDSFFYRADLLEIDLRLSQAQRVVWAATDFIGVVFVLTVVMPKADRANFIAAALVESFEFAARTSVGRGWLPRHDNISKHGASF